MYTFYLQILILILLQLFNSLSVNVEYKLICSRAI